MKGKLVQAASFWTFLCKRCCSMRAAKSLGGDKRKSDVAGRASGEESEAFDKKNSKFSKLSGVSIYP